MIFGLTQPNSRHRGGTEMFGSIFSAVVPGLAGVALVVAAAICFRRQRTTQHDVLDTLYCYGGVMLAVVSAIVVVHTIAGTFRGIRPLTGL